ncbi:hypothetical protein CIK66_18475 [Brachybacterium alimentarium]|uniref:Uncharacterized protein n=1 Tax=Brachybacterium alimentarium TaxID=47845 RepID=A0A2A3YED3_9MICO|nr:hypothetical protein CIK66_18475 [Brachybacterium alimentarium]
MNDSRGCEQQSVATGVADSEAFRHFFQRAESLQYSHLLAIEVRRPFNGFMIGAAELPSDHSMILV